jgi:hypothetical protein
LVETTTKNYAWVKPEIQHSPATWGGFLNNDLDSIDALVFANQGAAAAAQSSADAAQSSADAAQSSANAAQSSANAAQATANAALPIAGGTITGSLSVNGAATANGDLTVNGFLSGNSGNCQGTWSINTAAITNLEASTLKVDQNAYFAVATASTNFAIYGNSSTHIVQFSPQWAWNWRTADGLLSWNTPSGAVIQIDGSGNLSLETGNGFKPGGGPWAAVSDERAKQDIAPYGGGLDQVLKLLPITFRYNGKGGTRNDGKTYYGLSGQAVRPVMPELTVEMNDGLVGTDLGPLTLALVNAVKTLTERIKTLEARLA